MGEWSAPEKSFPAQGDTGHAGNASRLFGFILNHILIIPLRAFFAQPSKEGPQGPEERHVRQI
jgi:hypothetical protein